MGGKGCGWGRERFETLSAGTVFLIGVYIGYLLPYHNLQYARLFVRASFQLPCLYLLCCSAEQ